MQQNRRAHLRRCACRINIYIYIYIYIYINILIPEGQISTVFQQKYRIVPLLNLST